MPATPIISSGLVPSGVDIEGEREGRHTATPWDVVPSCEHHGPYVVSEFGSTICDFYTMSDPSSLSVRNGGISKPIHFMHEMADANAALVVHRVNAHDDLVAALRVTLRLAESWVRSELEGTSQYAAVMAELEPARAALSKAGAS